MATASRTDAEAPPFEGLEHQPGVDYALRTVQQSQVQFSAMADAKANIMITVCSIVISVSLTQLHRPAFLWPLLALDLFTAIALVTSLLCLLPSPRYPKRADGSLDTSSPGYNPLFFVHFHHLSLPEFERSLEERVASTGTLYRSLVKDIYGQGVVLARKKYRLLRWSYLSFLTGLFLGLAIAVAQLVWPLPL